MDFLMDKGGEYYGRGGRKVKPHGGIRG